MFICLIQALNTTYTR